MKNTWRNITLGEVAQIKGGKRIPKGQKLSTDITDYPYIRVTDFTDSGSIDIENIQYISKEIYAQIKNYTISDKDLYISIAGTIGKSGIVPKELNGANLTENACKLLFNNDIYNRFVYYFTQSQSFTDQAGLNTRTAAMPKLALSRLATITFSIPEFDEQKQIVAVLDQAFEAINKAQINIEQNIQNAKDLFQSKLNEVFSQKGDGWEEKKLGDILTLAYGKPLSQEDRDPEGLYAVYGANGIKNRSNKAYVNKKSLIVGRKGSAGEINYTEENFWPLDVTYFTEFDKEILELDFLYYLLVMQNLPSLAKGVKPGINRNDVYALDVTIPNISIQKEITLVLNQLSSQLNELENHYQSKIRQLEELKKSILQKAFTGELIN